MKSARKPFANYKLPRTLHQAAERFKSSSTFFNYNLFNIFVIYIWIRHHINYFGKLVAYLVVASEAEIIGISFRICLLRTNHGISRANLRSPMNVPGKDLIFLEPPQIGIVYVQILLMMTEKTLCFQRDHSVMEDGFKGEVVICFIFWDSEKLVHSGYETDRPVAVFQAVWQSCIRMTAFIAYCWDAFPREKCDDTIPDAVYTGSFLFFNLLMIFLISDGDVCWTLNGMNWDTVCAISEWLSIRSRGLGRGEQCFSRVSEDFSCFGI